MASSAAIGLLLVCQFHAMRIALGATD